MFGHRVSFLTSEAELFSVVDSWCTCKQSQSGFAEPDSDIGKRNLVAMSLSQGFSQSITDGGCRFVWVAKTIDMSSSLSIQRPMCPAAWWCCCVSPPKNSLYLIVISSRINLMPMFLNIDLPKPHFNHSMDDRSSSRYPYAIALHSATLRIATFCYDPFRHQWHLPPLWIYLHKLKLCRNIIFVASFFTFPPFGFSFPKDMTSEISSHSASQ